MVKTVPQVKDQIIVEFTTGLHEGIVHTDSVQGNCSVCFFEGTWTVNLEEAPWLLGWIK